MPEPVSLEARLAIAKPDIEKAFIAHPVKVFTRSDLEAILDEQRDFWRLGEASTAIFLKFLLQEGVIQKVIFEFPSRKMIRYVYGNPSPYSIILSLRPEGYFSHYTAIYLHELTEQVPRTVYLNAEQSPKPRQGAIIRQDLIDRAFKRPQRKTSFIAPFGDQEVVLLNGMHAGRLGVIEIESSSGEILPVTGLERTLIDITVRPDYSGGVFEVLKAFRAAQGRFSVNRLTAMLLKMNFAYPYHQAIGFYLDRVGGYKKSAVDLLRKFEIKYDFYLAYQMKDMSYSKEWRLFFPKGF